MSPALGREFFTTATTWEASNLAMLLLLLLLLSHFSRGRLYVTP